MNTVPFRFTISARIKYFFLGLLWCGCAHNAFAQTINCKPSCVEIKISRVLSASPLPFHVGTPAQPTPDPDQPVTLLAIPTFSSSVNTVPFGDTVTIIAPNLPQDVVIEYSVDNGKSWITGNQLIIDKKVDVSARVRSGQQISPILKGNFTPYYQRMLVIGNSIMAHGPAPQLGWYNFNGMAASAPEKDFVHLLTAQLQSLNPAMSYQLQAGTGLELDFGRPTYKMDEFDGPMQTYKPDLIVIRLGENVTDGEVPVRGFESQFRAFVERLVSLSGGRAVRIVTTTSVWEKGLTDQAIRKVINEKGWTLVDLQSIVGQKQYFAGQYADPSVAAHPNDAGMQKIADLIWNSITTYK